MTSSNGTYMFCDADLSFSIRMTCAGPSCSSILSHNSLTCTKTGSDSWDCTNGVKCASATGFTSNFSIADSNTAVSHTQNVTLSGTSFVFQQDGAGGETVSNGTTTLSSGGSSTAVASTTATSTAASPSASKSGSSSSHQSYSAMMLSAMLFLTVFVTQAQAQVTGSSIKSSLNSIFQFLDKAGDGKSLFDIGATAIAGEFNTFAIKNCDTLVSQGSGSLSGLPLTFGQCEEALAGAEMSQIGSSLGVTLHSYTGLGGISTSALTSPEEAAVLAADAGAIPELLLANSALCGLLVAVIQSAVQHPTSENLCAALESAAVGHEPTSTSSKAATTATAVSTTASPTTSQAAPTAAGSLPAGFSSNKCVECFLNTYISGLHTLAAEICNGAAVTTASAYDLSGIFCNPGITADPSSTAFCQALCADPCATFDVAAIVKQMGSDYIADPVANADRLGKLCNTCSSANLVPTTYQCKTAPTCLCGIGTQLCLKGCPKSV